VADDPPLRERISDVLGQIREETPRSPHTAACWGVISPLADGADRLVAREVLEDDTAALEAPLPFAREEYVRGFQGAGSQLEFEQLFKRASLITHLPPSRSRNLAYVQLGEYVVDHSDVLVALWDGEDARGEGGTAEVVAHARSRSVPLFWIFSKPDYEVERQQGDGVAREPFEELDAYNRARISDARFRQKIDEQERRWSQAATFAGLPAHELQPYVRWILPYLTRADMLAERYQARYFGFGTALFALAGLAVAAAAVQILSTTQLESFAVLESVFMLAALGLMAMARSQQVHRRWISYRALAERFRLAFFWSVVGLEAQQTASRDASDGLKSQDWTSRAFNEVYIERPKAGRPNFSLDALKRFLTDAWIGDQHDYYQRTARRNRRREAKLSWLVGGLFVVTLVVASFHGIGTLVHHTVPVPAEWLILIAIVLPAAGASLGGIQAQHEYGTNAIRFTQMAKRLSVIKRRMEGASDVTTLEAITEAAAIAMLDEHRGWLGMMEAHAFSLRELL
jgi:hypothetical protein